VQRGAAPPFDRQQREELGTRCGSHRIATQ
jgi:hypothetical protein